MLHALFITHGPETCPAAQPAAREVALDGLNRLATEGEARGVTIVGGWANKPGHALYVIADAPNAHVINDLAMDLGFGAWASVNVSPVVEMEDLRMTLERQVAGAS